MRPLFGRDREGEADALALGRHLDRHDLLEHLDPALDLRRLGRLVAEPVDEHLHPRDFLVLIALGLAQPLEHRVAQLDVLAVVADVVGQRAQVQVGDPGDDRVEEVAIVRDQDDRVRVGRQVFLEPVARVEIEVVGRLVEQQQAGPPEQQLGQRDAHLPAARERLGGLAEVVLAEAEAAQHGRDPQVDAVAVVAAELLLQLGVADQHRLVLALGHAVVAQPRLERVHLGLPRQQVGEGRRRLVEQGPAAVVQAVLRQVADGQPARGDHLAGVGLVDAGQDAQQGGLAGPVRAAQADPLPIADLPGDVVEEDAVAEGLVELRELDHVGAAGRCANPVL